MNELCFVQLFPFKANSVKVKLMPTPFVQCAKQVNIFFYTSLQMPCLHSISYRRLFAVQMSLARTTCSKSLNSVGNCNVVATTATST